MTMELRAFGYTFEARHLASKFKFGGVIGENCAATSLRQQRGERARERGRQTPVLDFIYLFRE